ncbi:uncharacterized protein DSM5745_08259 [Aspergillus mulundensis]|uniref:Uncharacterized protein n=1 Tax=Aspergillus mulundensis TaxID=1810919 RepID=A0A3D8RA09_9EURO|nr:hypothetical protein DSM5745_08259 [Aspergillus mulundensis]RDW70748.1 hypothetical protein DSM5745_08259 [Aspergillus mulundensis]
MSSAQPTTTDNSAVDAKDAAFGFACLRNIRDGKVNLVGVANALNYSNVRSVGNRFRALREKYGFTGLECTTADPGAKVSPQKRKAATGATGAPGDDDNQDNGDGQDGEDAAAPPAKRKPGRPKKGTGKGAGRGRKKAVAAEPVDEQDDAGASGGEEADADAEVPVKGEFDKTA